MSHFGLYSRQNEESISSSASTLAPTLKIGPMEHHLSRRTRSSNSTPRAMLYFPIFQINKRISFVLFDYSFVNLGLNSRPTFFGCNASNYTSFTRPPPLVVYFPHVGWTAYTNFSTFTLEYSNASVQAYIDNGVATAVISPHSV
jgi:Lysophospholipase catalytic domain